MRKQSTWNWILDSGARVCFNGTMTDTHWTDTDRNTQPEGCHLCGTENVPLTNYSRAYGGYQGPHWLCKLCANTQAGSMTGAGNWIHHADHVAIVADVAAMLHAAGLVS